MSPLTHRNRLAPEGNTKMLSHVEILIEPHEVELDSETSTDRRSCDYTLLSRRPRNSWTLEQREAICILRRWYGNSWKELAQVFNAHFSTDEITSKVTGSALSTQLYEMQRYGVKNEAFLSIFVETLFVDEFCTWASMRGDLERTAERAGIALRKVLSEDKEEMLQKCSQPTKSMKRKKIICGTDSVLGNLAYESEEGQSSEARPAKQQKYLTPSPSPQKGFGTITHVTGCHHGSVATRNKQYNHLPATPQSLCKPPRVHSSPQDTIPQKKVCTESENVPTDGDGSSLGQIDQLPRPQIVFRFYNDNSSGVNAPTGMRAGLFQDSKGRLSPPPDIDSEAFRREAAKHFSWTRKPTPFISMYESILPVLHRGLLSTIDASIAVIDLHTVSRSQRRNHSKVYVAAHIIKRLGLKQEAYGYRAISEWLVWGMIDKNAIAATFKVNDLRRFLTGSPDVCIVLRFPEIESARNANEYREKLKRNMNQVGRASGRVVGKLLAFVALPEFYIERAAKKIARDWRLDGNMSAPRLRRYLGGVQLGLQQTQEDIRTSTQAKVKARLTKYLKQRDSGLQRKGADDVPSEQASPKSRPTKYLKQVDSGLQRQGAVDLPPKQPRSKRRMAIYFRQVDSGLRRNGAEDVPSKQARPKRRMAEYLRQVDSGLEQEITESRSSGRGSSRPRLASYLQRVDLGQARDKDAATYEYGASGIGLKSDVSLSRRRLIEAVCSGS